MKKIWLLLLLSSLTGMAQQFSWSEEPTAVQDESAFQISRFFTGRLFVVKTKYNMETFNKDVFVDILDPRDDFEKDTMNLSVEQPLMGLNMSTLLEIFPLTDRDYVFFQSEFDRNTKSTTLSWLKANMDTGKKSKLEAITSMPGKNAVNPGNMFVAQSPGKTHYAVLKEPSYDKKVNQKITFALLDKNYKVLKEKEYEFPFSSKQSGNHEMFVSDAGIVYLVKEIDLPKMKPYKSVYIWNPATDAVTEQTLKLDNDWQIHQIKGNFNNDEFYLYGLYTDAGSRNFQFRASFNGSSGVTSLGIMVAKFGTDGLKKYMMLNDTGRISDLNIKDFVPAGDKTWALLDRLNANGKRRPLNQTNMQIIYDYTYTDQGIEIGMIDNATGKLDWRNSIKVDRPATVNDNGNLHSYMYFIGNDGIDIIYNQYQGQNLSQLPVLKRYSKSGQLTGTTNIPGMLPQKYSLDTSMAVKMPDGKYIVRAKLGNSRAVYGFLNF
ncbi:DUF4374 domain-containing protein [Flavobacterium longum]|uniref:hypothetical protein n=1 Tax=Flavobacterium longum TaxID=1299340 RepID=UPI0039E97DDF